MKGRHISKKAQRKARKPAKGYREMSIPELTRLADKGDEGAMRELRRVCGFHK